MSAILTPQSRGNGRARAWYHGPQLYNLEGKRLVCMLALRDTLDVTFHEWMEAG